MDGQVVVVGSVNVDLAVRTPRLPRPGETVTGGTFTTSGGGKGANQAVAAARAGASVVFLGAVGSDDLGADALAALRRDGVDTSRCAVVAHAPTGVAVIVVDDEGENQIAVAPGANARLGAADVAEALADLPMRGVLLANLEVPDAAILAAATRACDAGMTFVLNPAPAREVDAALLRLGPIVVPNEHEAVALTGAGGPEAAARSLRQRTGSAVVVTLGAEGALVVDDTERVVAAPSVDVVDTTGAGDTFCGTLAASLASGSPLGPAVERAVAAASVSVTRLGAR